MYWPKLTAEQIKEKVFNALHRNTNYRSAPILGIPATYLDTEVFYQDAPFLTNAPFISTLVANPNHIGCHTLAGGVSIFEGTQQLEVDLIKICAEQIFRGEPDQQDGYVATGGTEANIEALWVYRNYFMNIHGAKPNEIAVVCSEDSHYSFPKGINLLHLKGIILPVDQETREIDLAEMELRLLNAVEQGIKHFIITLNLSTTMFGSIDDINAVTQLLLKLNLDFKLHIDGAFGGFVYPFVHNGNSFTFQNPHITSFTIDGHKMLQTPYGTGIFLIRKGYLDHVKTNEAQYIPGNDYTLCGSRSGANAVVVWMVLHSYGSQGWKAKMLNLVDLTTDVCIRLRELGISFFRNPYLNIITIKAEGFPKNLALKYHLVANTYEHEPGWWKIVIMPHITRGMLDAFFDELKSELALQKH